MNDRCERACDDVIVGGGFGGLLTANLLAQAGRRVVLVEARHKIGGLLRSYQREGIDCPVGVHYFGTAGRGELLGQVFDLLGVRDALKLRRMGAEGVIDRYLFDDLSFDLPPSLDAFEAILRDRFADHAGAVDFVIDTLRRTTDALRIDAEGNIARGAFGNEAFDRSAHEALVARGCPDGLIKILGVQTFWSGCELDDCPLGYSLMFLGSLLRSAWEIGCRGTELAEAIAERCRAVGVQIVTADPVGSVVVSDGRARGVILASGDRIDADKVVCAIHPKTVIGMLPEGSVSDVYRNGILGLRETPGAFGVVALLDAARHQAPAHNAFRIRNLAGAKQEGVYVQIRPSTVPGYHRMVMIAHSDYDEWRAWEGAPLRKRGAEYEAKKRRMADRLFEMAREVVGPIDDPKIIDLWSPLTLRHYTGTARGGIYGVRHGLSDGLERMVLTRTPVGGLFMVGQNAIAPGLVGVALGALRVVGDIVGRRTFRRFLAERVGAAP